VYSSWHLNKIMGLHTPQVFRNDHSTSISRWRAVRLETRVMRQIRSVQEGRESPGRFAIRISFATSGCPLSGGSNHWRASTSYIAWPPPVAFESARKPMLEAVAAGFIEGFEINDLQEATRALKQLEASPESALRLEVVSNKEMPRA
jgi:hypothetical protein